MAYEEHVINVQMTVADMNLIIEGLSSMPAARAGLLYASLTQGRANYLKSAQEGTNAPPVDAPAVGGQPVAQSAPEQPMWPPAVDLATAQDVTFTEAPSHPLLQPLIP